MPDTVFHILDADQVSTVAEQLVTSLERGAGSVLLIASNDEEVRGQMEKAAKTLEIEHLPEPELVTVSTIYVLAFPVPAERLVEVTKEWSSK